MKELKEKFDKLCWDFAFLGCTGIEVEGKLYIDADKAAEIVKKMSAVVKEMNVGYAAVR